MSASSKFMNAFHSYFHITNSDYLETFCTLRDIHLIISRAADKAANTSTLKIKSHNINSWCVRHNPVPFKLFVCLFDLILNVPSTIFQLNRDGSSWVEPVLSWDKCVLLKDHNAVTPVRLEPAAPRSRVKHSTTEPLRSRTVQTHLNITEQTLWLDVMRASCMHYYFDHTHLSAIIITLTSQNIDRECA